MKQTLHQGGNNALNLYSTTAGAYLGWAYLPDIVTKPGQAYLDGIVIDWESMPGTSTTYAGRYDQGETVTHETGHWLNLEHTFFGGCNAKGDFVADTPAERSPTSGCPIGKDTCPAIRASTRSTTTWTTRTTVATRSSPPGRRSACATPGCSTEPRSANLDDGPASCPAHHLFQPYVPISPRWEGAPGASAPNLGIRPTGRRWCDKGIDSCSGRAGRADGRGSRTVPPGWLPARPIIISAVVPISPRWEGAPGRLGAEPWDSTDREALVRQGDRPLFRARLVALTAAAVAPFLLVGCGGGGGTAQGNGNEGGGSSSRLNRTASVILLVGHGRRRGLLALLHQA